MENTVQDPKKSLYIVITSHSKELSVNSIHDNQLEAQNASDKVAMTPPLFNSRSPETCVFEVEEEKIFISEKRKKTPLPMDTPIDQMMVEDIGKELRYRELRHELARMRTNDSLLEHESSLECKDPFADYEKRKKPLIPEDTPVDQMRIEDIKKEIEYRELCPRLEELRKLDKDASTKKEKEAKIAKIRKRNPMFDIVL